MTRFGVVVKVEQNDDLLLQWMREGNATQPGQVVRKFIPEAMFYEIQGRCLLTVDDGKVFMRQIPKRFFAAYGFDTIPY